jgi:hypothetical protein
MKSFLVWLNTPWFGCTFCSIFPGLGDFLACTFLPNGEKSLGLANAIKPSV